MRIWISILLMILLTNWTLAQELGVTRDQGQNVSAKTSSDSVDVQQQMVDSKIQVWTLANQYSKQYFTQLDTSTIGFNNYDPIFQKSISNNYLGFMGAPYESNIFFDRTNDNHFYFLKHFDAYRQTQNKVEYYNTTTPFASLYYVQGKQGTQLTHQVFKAFFTYNIDSVTNIGFRFNAIKTPGQYLLQENKHKFINVFASRNAERLNSYLNVITGSDALNENGGISDSTMNRFVDNWYIVPVRTDPYQLGVNLGNVIENTSKSFSFFTSHEYLMGQIPFLVPKVKADLLYPDSLLADSIVNVPASKEFIPKYSVQYSAEFENHRRNVYEKSVDQLFFDTTFIKTSDHTDSAFFSRFSHILQVKAFEDENRKFTFVKRVFIENEMVTAKHPLPDGQRKYNYSNVYLGGEISRTTSAFLNWYALARFALIGRNIGDAIVKGNIDKPFVFNTDTAHLTVEGWYQDQSADIFQEHWMGNHFKWENKFKKQHEVVIRGIFSYPRFHAQAGLNYALLSNYLYNNEFALPDQYNGEFSIVSGWLNKDFHLGRFGWSNKMVWQALSNDAVLHLPVFSVYSSIYYSHYLFKVMKLQFGAEVFYHTKFKSNSYQPATTQFYLQNDQFTGGYPMVNLFVNAKLKRTSAFAELYHANSMFNMGEFFSSPQYPLDQMAFRFGFYWTFYD